MLAETGSIAWACREVGITPRSAYRFRTHPRAGAFARAWDDALTLAGHRLLAIAFERATVGTPRELWRDGQLVAQSVQPSDKLLMFLLQHLVPHRFAARDKDMPRTTEIANATHNFPRALAELADSDIVPDPGFPVDELRSARLEDC